MEYLISKGILKQTYGSYGDNLIVTGTYGNSRGKTRYVTTPIYNYLQRLKLEETSDFNKIKDNQRYMFT